MPSKTHSRARKVTLLKDKEITYYIDLKQPIEDGVFDISDFESHLKTTIKVNGKKGLDNIEINTKEHKLQIKTKVVFSKRYIKYLTKKYLKKQDLREYLRVVATDKHGYSIRFFNINEDAAQEDK